MRHIDLAGPDGNAYALIGVARMWCSQLDIPPIGDKMRAGTYNDLLDAFDATFKHIVDYQFMNDPRRPALNESGA